jgi:hypothetical protein
MEIIHLQESFLCLKKLRVKSPVFAAEIIKACAIIHNLRIDDVEDPAADEDDEIAPNDEIFVEEEGVVREARARGKRRLHLVLDFFT